MNHSIVVSNHYLLRNHASGMGDAISHFFEESIPFQELVKVGDIRCTNS